MARDPYELCPCGSGSKLKFCCADVAAEMDKVERLLGNNQPHMALQAMEKLRETHPESQWVMLCLASTLINDEKPADARRLLKPILKKHPEQPFANVLYALASYNTDGYPGCKRAAHRAFKQSYQAYPDLVATLANAVAESLQDENQPLAARQHLVVALRFAKEELRRILFENLMELDGDSSISYPLRGARQPMEFDPGSEGQKQAKLAARLAAVACFDEAADALEVLAEHRPDEAGLRYNIGLFRAWDGDHRTAVTCFRKAAALFEDREMAVECEVLAQCLEQSDPERAAALRLRRFELRSVSQLLSDLDRSDRFARVDQGRDVESPEDAPVARYVFLNRSVSNGESFKDAAWDSLPVILGRIAVFDSDPQAEQSAQAFLVGQEGEELDQTVTAFRAATGDLASEIEAAEDEQSAGGDVTGYIPEFELGLRWTGYIPPEASAETAQRTARQRWDHVIEQLWPNRKLAALGDRSPLEAAGDESAAVALEASLTLFDAYADSRGFMLPIAALRERLSLQPPPPLPLAEKIPFNSLTNLQLLRLDPSQLNDRQFDQMFKRVMVMRHSRKIHEVLQEALKRPDHSGSPQARDRSHAALAALCGNSLRSEESLEWIEKGKMNAAGMSNSFEAVLQWKMRELALRIQSPGDPQLTPLLKDLWEHYGAKLPQLREYLVTLVEAADVKAPWDQAIVAPAGVTSGVAASWSQEQPDPGKKLWLPNQ